MRNVITLANSCEDGNCPGIDQWTDTQDFRRTNPPGYPQRRTS